VWGLRAPRALSAFAAGGLLALAGTLLQVLLRNPLADPYVLGISGGAAVGALAAMLAGVSGALVSGAALAGAMVVSAVLVALALRSAAWETHRMLLAGVAIASAAAAIVSIILTVAPAAQLHGMLFWLMGDVGTSTPEAAWAALALVATGAALATLRGDALDALALGREKAAILGIDVRRTEWTAFGIAAIATATAVLLAGSIGFVGIVVPHLLRLAGIHRHWSLLPLATLAGGMLVTVADLVARTIAAPVELPVGAITALVGVPVLLVLVTRVR